MDVEEYLERINYSAKTEAGIGVLNTLQKGHLLSIPFENLDIHYKIPIELNPIRIFEKVVNKKRGGFCYELNSLFYELLDAIGFNVKMISARVFSQKRQVFSPEFDHLAIIARINSIDHLVDVGFGEFAFNPLKIDLNTVQNDERGQFRIEKFDETYYKVSKQVDGDWIPEYIFSLKKRELSEFSEMCHYNQASPESHFTQNTFCSVPTEKGRITVSTNRIKITEGDSIIELPVTGETEFLSALEKYFQIRLVDNMPFVNTPVT